MPADVNSIRAILEQRRRATADAHRAGATGFETCAALSAMMDEIIIATFESLPRESRNRVAVLPLGGYGRGELFPHSDVDVMVLCSAGDSREGASGDARAFLHQLWDAGLDVGHSVRTVEEAVALHGDVLDAWTSVLESRFLCGNTALFDELFTRLRGVIAGGSDLWLLEGVFLDAQNRHERYGNSVKLLEPNIKKSAGGLRDIHNILWLYRGTREEFFQPARAGEPATPAFIDHLRAGGGLDDEEYDEARRAIEFLFRVRHEMHYRQGSLHDALDYALQLQVADGLGYGASEGPVPAGRRAVEHFMHEYYLHSRNVFRLHQRLGHQFREVLESGQGISTDVESFGPGLLLSDDALSVKPEIRSFESPREIFESFALAAENDVDLDFRLRAVLERSAGLIGATEQSSSQLAALFRRILLSRRVAATLHAMNDLDILGRYIPEFGELVAFFQHNVYHYYTADEHTLIAVGKAEGLREDQGILHEVFRNLRQKDILYLAVLLHDIGKPHGVADHEITGIEIARTVLRRLGMEEAFPDVSFLVRNHLLMEQVAFRRNVHDPDTIREFARRFERPETLDYLYVLTYADLSAVNTGVWTAWKAAMLQELYQRGAEVLRRDLHGGEIDAFHQARHEEVTGRIVEALSATMPREHVEMHLDAMQSDAYVGLFSEEEIGHHIRMSAVDQSVSTIFTHVEGYTEVTVIARDAPFALSKFCAVFSANDASIFDANIFTRSDGVIIDRFRVTSAAGRRELEQQVCSKIADDLRQVVEGSIDIDRLFAEHKRRWKRRPKHPANPNIRTGVEFEDTPTYTIIDVYAPDAVGLLYRVTETMSRLGLDIYFAKIATRGDGVVDAFYVLDRDRKQVRGRLRREAIRNDILATFRQMAEEELQ